MIPPPVDPVTLPSVGTILAGMGVVGSGATLYVIKQQLHDIRETRDKMRSLWTAIFGEPGTEPPNGIKRSVATLDTRTAHMETRFEQHVTGEERWQQEMVTRIGRNNDHTQAILTTLEERIDAQQSRKR